MVPGWADKLGSGNLPNLSPSLHPGLLFLGVDPAGYGRLLSQAIDRSNNQRLNIEPAIPTVETLRKSNSQLF